MAREAVSADKLDTEPLAELMGEHPLPDARVTENSDRLGDGREFVRSENRSSTPAVLAG